MNFGFVIDNRRCIGCHACTVACKVEHDVPVGVNRTWVKYIEKGVFPDTRRLFSVMRCNHCAKAPCVEICPTGALFTRGDGIVDFDNRRCIACKACMQACPYDAIYIDPQSHTAAKCNYCAHRIETGLEPSCVVVCPERAIVAGDIDDATSEIGRLLAGEAVTVRCEEKGTEPKLFYIEGDEASLSPRETIPRTDYMWSAQQRGVGYHANRATDGMTATPEASSVVPETRRAYDAPREGIVWGWEVAAYVWTKAVACGLVFMLFIAMLVGRDWLSGPVWWAAAILSVAFLGATTALLVMDLGQPRRFLYVLLRPQWRSWLVRGGYALTALGALLALLLAARGLGWRGAEEALTWAAAGVAVVASVYTAFLFAQAKGRDFWQSPLLVLHMLAHSLTAGAAVLAIILAVDGASGPGNVTRAVLLGTLVTSAVLAGVELSMPHATGDIHLTVRMIVAGRYAVRFWCIGVVIGLIVPIVMLLVGGAGLGAVAGGAALIGLFVMNDIWVRAPQELALS